MNRRELLTAAAAFALVAPAARAGGDSSYVKYSPEAYEAAVASGKPLLLDFYTEW